MGKLLDDMRFERKAEKRRNVLCTPNHKEYTTHFGTSVEVPLYEEKLFDAIGNLMSGDYSNFKVDTYRKLSVEEVNEYFEIVPSHKGPIAKLLEYQDISRETVKEALGLFSNHTNIKSATYAMLKPINGLEIDDGLKGKLKAPVAVSYADVIMPYDGSGLLIADKIVVQLFTMTSVSIIGMGSIAHIKTRIEGIAEVERLLEMGDFAHQHLGILETCLKKRYNSKIPGANYSDASREYNTIKAKDYNGLKYTICYCKNNMLGRLKNNKVYGWVEIIIVGLLMSPIMPVLIVMEFVQWIKKKIKKITTPKEGVELV